MISGNYILTIETSGNTCGVAISCDSSLIAEFNVFKPNSHDKVLAGLIKKIVQDSDIGFNDLKAVAVSSGPGSFTGLRIGAAIAKGLCFNNEIKLISIPTLEAIGHHLANFLSDFETDIITILPSNKELYYFQKFDPSLSVKSKIKLAPISEIINNKLENELIGGVISSNDSVIYPSIKSLTLTASLISKFADKLFSECKFVEADEFTPLYIQEFIPKTK